MKTQNTSTVLINIGRAMAANLDLLNLATNTYGRGVQVVVGGYAQKLASDDEAPFIWVYADEDDTEVSGNDALAFTAKVVLGICPQKDIPSTDEMFALAGATLETAKEVADALAAVAEAVPSADPAKEAAEAISTAAADTYDDIEEKIEAAKASATEGNWDAMLASVTSAETDEATLASKVTEMGETVEGVEAAEAAMIAAGVAGTALTTARAALSSERTAVAESFARFIDDPFISEVEEVRDSEHNGVTIYGAIRTVDAFKRIIISILQHGDFGMPVKSIKYKNQAVAHYPLDWSEHTVTFENTETLSL